MDALKLIAADSMKAEVPSFCLLYTSKKQFVTVLDASCSALDTMVVSAGKIGHQVELAPADLQRAVQARLAPVACCLLYTSRCV